MKKFEEVFFKTLEEAISLPPEEIDLRDDGDALSNSMEEEGGEDTFNTLAPEGYAERHLERAKEWKGRIDDFVEWLNGAENSFVSDLGKLDDEYPGINKDAGKKISDIAQDLSSLGQLVIAIPRAIKQQEREEAERNPQLDRF